METYDIIVLNIIWNWFNQNALYIDIVMQRWIHIVIKLRRQIIKDVWICSNFVKSQECILFIVVFIAYVIIRKLRQQTESNSDYKNQSSVWFTQFLEYDLKTSFGIFLFGNIPLYIAISILET